jgi:hypothetical protein
MVEELGTADMLMSTSKRTKILALTLPSLWSLGRGFPVPGVRLGPS